MKKTISLLFVGLALAFSGNALLRAAAPTSSIAQSGWQPHDGIPPAELWGAGRLAERLYFTDLVGTIDFEVDTHKITIDWRHVPSSTLHRQEIVLPFWPTAIESMGGVELLIAGKRRTSNRTLLARWSFGAPPVYDVVNPDGSVTLTVGDAAVLATDILYDDVKEGLDMIAHVEQFHGAGQNAYIAQFWDSRDVYLISETSPGTVELTLLASKDVASLPQDLVVPELSVENNFERFSARKHLEFGYVYIFSAPGRSSVDPLVLRDQDLDGSLDGYHFCTGDDWEQLSYYDANQYEW